LKAEEDLKTKEKEESSASSEYFPEPDEEGEEKKDNIVRKGYGTFLQKLEKDKQDLSQLLEKKNIPKPTHSEAPKIQAEILPNLNKKERTDVPIDDAFLFKRNVPEEKKVEKVEKVEDKDQSKQAPSKKVIPVTEVFKVKTKKHRGINTIDELEKKTVFGSPKVNYKSEENVDQNKGDNKGTTQAKDNQTSWDENKQGNTQVKDNQTSWDENKQRNRNDNYRGNNYNRDDNRCQRNRPPQKSVQKGRGRFDIGSSDDFPSLSDNIEVPKPSWVPNTTTQQQ